MKVGFPQALVRTWLLYGLFLLSIGCSEVQLGGGGGIGGTGKNIEADTMLVGVIDGFGSIIVNDQLLETDFAQVSIDGLPAAIADLRVGMTIQVRSDSTTGKAVELRYQPDVNGQVTAVDADLQSFEILGQLVVLNNSTVLDDLAQSEVVPGVSLEVSGVRNADGEIVATYIRKTLLDPNEFVAGRVNVDPAADQRLIGGAILDVSQPAAELGLQVQEYKDIYLEPGSLVRLEGALQSASITQSDTGPVVADESSTVLAVFDVQNVLLPTYNNGDVVQLLGVVGGSVGDRSYLVADVVVTLGDSTEAVSGFGLPIDLPESIENRMVLVDGTAINTNGTVLADRIQFLDIE